MKKIPNSFQPASKILLQMDCQKAFTRHTFLKTQGPSAAFLVFSSPPLCTLQVELTQRQGEGLERREWRLEV